ncbi:MAG: hypothetical protein O7G31_14385 [Calditrichaeota bacterium]|nr:hypothetical protein [Calditrichota bacterium]
MNELSKNQEKARNARSALRQADESLYLERNRLAAKQKQLQETRRLGRAGEAEVQRLEREIKGLQALVGELQLSFTSGEQVLADIMGRFELLHQPQSLVEQLDDRLPFLLLPVRIETRFMKVDESSELWVRIFPDDIAVHTHEKILTKEELEAGRIYWRELWRAAQENDEDRRTALQKGAWRVLAGKVSSQRAAWIAAETEPETLDISEPSDLNFPEIDEDALKQESWSRAPRTQMMPDRFVVMTVSDGEITHELVAKQIPDPLFLGPDPAKGEHDLAQEGGDLKLGENIQWLHDFNKAVEVGMGVRIPLGEAEANEGFDRLLVLGLRLSADAEESQKMFEEQIENHHFAADGIGFVPQGTATNNTGRQSAGFGRLDPGEETSFEVETGPTNFEMTNEKNEKVDAQRFAEALGIDHAPLQYLQNAGQQDVAEALAMNKALWGATMGYFLDEMLGLSEVAVRNTRLFFADYVTGRGSLPAFRVGNQPYGILPATAFSAWRWSKEFEGDDASYLTEIEKVLRRLEEEWDKVVDQVSHAGGQDKSFQNLLDMLSLHATSVEFFRRRTMGKKTSWNYHNFFASPEVARITLDYVNQRGLELLNTLGFDFKAPPFVFDLSFFLDHDRIEDPFVSDVERAEDERWSENDRLQAKYTVPGEADLKNYIGWLLRSELDKLKKQEFIGLEDERLAIPHPLLYRLLRQGLLATYNNDTRQLYVNHELATHADFREQEMTNVRAERDVTRWEFMEAPIGDVLPDVSNSRLSIVEYFLSPEGHALPEALTSHEVRACLEKLENLPTARLERLFAEHIDLCSYRLDAWMTGMVNRRLHSMRYSKESEEQYEQRTTGLYLGAFGWLEEVRPGPDRTETPAGDVPASLREPDKSPIFDDPANGGFIHGPSINHAVAAAVLRNAYLTHADQEKASVMSVNLSSERVRTALSMLEGVRNGQELGALLGYQFERGLQDRHGDPGLAQYFPNFRKKYPLVADRITPDDETEDDAITTKEATNVLDGYALLEAAFLNDNPIGYDYDVEGLPAAGTPSANAIISEVKRMFATFDAIADLALAEGVFQATQGNFERAGAMLKAVNQGGHPPEPDIVKTPRSGAAINHKVAIHFETTDDFGTVWPNPTPRASAEAGLNKWLAQILGPPDEIKLWVDYTDGDGTNSETLSFSALKVQPIDIIYLVGDNLENETTELESRLDYAFRRKKKSDDPTWDHSVELRFRFMDRDGFEADEKSLFELLPLFRILRNLVTSCRPLGADDYQLGSEQSTDLEIDDNSKGYDPDTTKIRVDNTISELESAIKLLLDQIEDPDNPPDLDTLNFAVIRAGLIALANFGIPDAFPENALDSSDEVKAQLLAQAVSTYRHSEKMFKKAQDLANLEGADQTGLSVEEKVEFYRKAAQHVFGESFNFLPRFMMKNIPELTAAIGFREGTPDKNLTRYSQNPLIVDEWLQGIAKVRERMALLAAVRSYHETFNENELSVKPLQLPFRPEDYWVAVPYPEVMPDQLDDPDVFKPEGDFLSIVQHIPRDYDAASLQTGLLLDEWVEVIPNRVETSGIAVNYNQPNTEPPQTLLLAVSPEITGSWKWAHLVATLNETLARAKKRGVEPDQLAQTALGQVLPSIITAVTSYPSATIATDLVYQSMVAAPDVEDSSEG